MKIKNNGILLIASIIFTLVICVFTGDLFSEENRQFPDWINKLIEKEKAGAVANPPAPLRKCNYKGAVVYYLPPRCCDIQGVLCDENGNFICHPDGGLTGNGDGKCVDFETRECVVIWKDTRSMTPVQNK